MFRFTSSFMVFSSILPSFFSVLIFPSLFCCDLSFLSEEEPEFREVFHFRSLYPGSSLNLKCSSRGSPLPQIRWYRYEMVLDHDPLSNIHHRIRIGSGGSGYRIADYVDEEGSIISHLNISSISVEDGGLYSCEAVNEISSKRHTALVQVYGPPMIHSMGNKSVVSSGKFHLDCPVSGFPIQEIHWRKGENIFSPFLSYFSPFLFYSLRLLFLPSFTSNENVCS